MIWGLLNIYPELSFTELSEKLGKSKSTLSPHLHELIETGLVQVSREEKVRGSIPAKYYSIVKDALEKIVFLRIDTSKGINKKNSEKIINNGRAKINYSKRILETGVKFWDTIDSTDDSLEVVEILKNLPSIRNSDIKNGEFNHTRFFLTEAQYRRWQELYFDLAIKFDIEISKEHNNNPNIEKPYYFFAFVLPIKFYIETINKIANKKRN